MSDDKDPYTPPGNDSSGCGCIALILWVAFLFVVFGVALRILKAAITFAFDI